MFPHPHHPCLLGSPTTKIPELDEAGTSMCRIKVALLGVAWMSFENQQKSSGADVLCSQLSVAGTADTLEAAAECTRRTDEGFAVQPS